MAHLLTLDSTYLYSSQPNPTLAPGDTANSAISTAPGIDGAKDPNLVAVSQRSGVNYASLVAQPVDTIFVATRDHTTMGGERNTERLMQSKTEYPVRAKKPVAKIFPKLYLDRIEGIYKSGQYEKWNLRS